MSDLKNKLREKTVGSEKKFKTKIVEIDGEKVEVRQPTVATRAQIIKKCRIPIADNEEEIAQNVDYSLMQVYSVIFCTFVPGTDERVFDVSDKDALLNQPTNSFVDELSTVAMELMNVEPQQAAKN